MWLVHSLPWMDVAARELFTLSVLSGRSDSPKKKNPPSPSVCVYYSHNTRRLSTTLVEHFSFPFVLFAIVDEWRWWKFRESLNSGFPVENQQLRLWSVFSDNSSVWELRERPLWKWGPCVVTMGSSLLVFRQMNCLEQWSDFLKLPRKMFWSAL